MTICGDGATITNIPLINILAMSPNNLFVFLDIADCAGQMAQEGKKCAKYLSTSARPLIRWLEDQETILNGPKPFLVVFIMFDGASNTQ